MKSIIKPLHWYFAVSHKSRSSIQNMVVGKCLSFDKRCVCFWDYPSYGGVSYTLTYQTIIYISQQLNCFGNAQVESSWHKYPYLFVLLVYLILLVIVTVFVIVNCLTFNSPILPIPLFPYAYFFFSFLTTVNGHLCINFKQPLSHGVVWKTELFFFYCLKACFVRPFWL